ncbi:MAG: transketolase family protein [Lachnospiraceae bacterium]|jgi:transketolase|nr:transketolase family protein [Lachnospiraceae bacterium]
MAGMTINVADLFSLRDAVGACLESLGEQYPNMIVCSADVDVSSRISGFKKKFPERSYNVGIAEQDLMSFCAGMAIEGFIPFAFSFAPFASMRAAEQVRTDICYSNLPVRIVANYAGYSGAESGCTHCALEDCAIMSSFANMTVIEPGDPFQIARVLKATMEWPGPVYIRMGKEATTSLYEESEKYEIGKALTPRAGEDGAFIASGIVVHHAMEAAEIVKAKTGAEIRVIDMHTIKPLDKEAVIEAAKTGRIVCAQDHNRIGGLGYAVGNTLAEAGVSCKFKILGCPDEFVPLATPNFLYHLNEYDAEGLANNMMKML